MNIFLSWSGRPSHDVAMILRSWLPKVLPQVKGWVSSEDIPKGRRWGREIDGQLQGTAFCIVCIVPGNVREPWINFEAGAIARAVDEGHVTPFLVGVGTEALTESPLSMFQATLFERADVKRLLETINHASDSPLPSDDLARRFRERWSELSAAVAAVDYGPPDSGQGAEDEDDDGPHFLEEEQEKLLVLLGEVDHAVTIGALAQHLGERPIRVEYWIDQLLAQSLIHDHLSTVNPTTFSVSAVGRAYLVENDLI